MRQARYSVMSDQRMRTALLACPTRQTFLAVFKIASLCILLLVLITSNGWAQAYIKIGVSDHIKALKDKDKVVRSCAAYALGGIGREAKAGVPALMEVLRDTAADVRWEAAYALGRIGPAAKDAIPALIEALKDIDNDVRRAAAGALGRIRPGAKDAVPALIEALKDTDAIVRWEAAYVLWRMGPTAKAAISALIEVLRDRNEDSEVREQAAWALWDMKSAAKAAVPALIEVLRDKNEDWMVRGAAAAALGGIGRGVKAAVPALIEALKDMDKDVRSGAMNGLGWIGPEAKNAVPALIEVLKSKNEDIEVRRSATEALGNIGPEVTAIPDLIAVLKDKNENFEVKNRAAWVLKIIAENLQDMGDTNSISDLEKAREAIKASGFEETARDVNRSIYALRAMRRANVWNLVIEWVPQNKWISGILVYLMLALFLSYALLWLRPLWLLRINENLQLYTKCKLPDWIGGMNVPVRYILLVGFFHYHRRVLDAWISKHIDSAREAFQEKPTARDRSIHIPMPAVLDGKVIGSVTGEHLRPTFAKRRGILLVWGEGGSGKTSLACQVAKWAMSEDKATRLCDEHLMLPVLIEHDLDYGGTGGRDAFTEAIRGQLRDLIGAEDPLSRRLIDHLLIRRRVLVIVDRFSEMSEATRNVIRPSDPDFLVNALIVTSRIEEELGGVSRGTIEPIRIQGNRLSTFMEAYLVQRGKRDLFDDPEYFDACRWLSLIVGQRDITVLLAKLYAEQMISSKENRAGGQLPDNIPALMLSYLNELNREARSNEPDDRTVHRTAKVIAWECLKKTYRTTTASRNDVLSALREEGNAEQILKYLEDRLRLVQTIGSGRDHIRFPLDPLAEYLAGLYLMEQYGENGDSWREFLAQADKMPGAPETIKGFLLAVLDCYIAKSIEAKVPDFVQVELAKRANLDREAVI